MNLSSPVKATRQRQAGVTMIEVLVTVLVVSLGLLGMAALQGVSIQTNQSANFRTQATLLGQQLTESMRSNRVQVSALGVVSSNLAGYSKAFAAPIPSGDPVITMQLTTFQAQLARVLPNAQFSVEVAPVDRLFEGRTVRLDNVTITVRISDSRLTDRFAETADSDFELETQI